MTSSASAVASSMHATPFARTESGFCVLSHNQLQTAREIAIACAMVVLYPLTLPQSHAWAAAIFVNEFDACSLERPADGSIVCASQRRFLVRQFRESPKGTP
jgi:hypothetical protein